MTTLAFKVRADAGQPYVLLLRTAKPAEDAEWRVFVHAIERLVREAGAPLVSLVLTDGGAPDAGQRKQLAALAKGAKRDVQVHVFSNNRIAVGVVTAIRWLVQAPIEAHSPERFWSVCELLSLDLDQVRQDLLDLQRQVLQVRVAETVCGTLTPHP